MYFKFCAPQDQCLLRDSIGAIRLGLSCLDDPAISGPTDHFGPKRPILPVGSPRFA